MVIEQAVSLEIIDHNNEKEKTNLQVCSENVISTVPEKPTNEKLILIKEKLGYKSNKLDKAEVESDKKLSK
jgi:hypothetical protein